MDTFCITTYLRLCFTTLEFTLTQFFGHKYNFFLAIAN